MKSNAESFLALVLEDATLRQRVLPLAVKNDLAAISNLAAENGLPCSEEELASVYKDGKISLPEAPGEDMLTDEHLAQIAGGKEDDTCKPPGGGRLL